MKKLIISICLMFVPVIVCGQFESNRVGYEVEYSLKGTTPDTTVTIDSTGVFEITASWDAVTGFDISGVVPVYDDSTHWVSVARVSETIVTAPIQVDNGIYSFRVWSEYVHKSGNITKSTAPSPEFLVEFILPEKPPERVFLRMRFESKQ